jgi:hypothetical protein
MKGDAMFKGEIVKIRSHLITTASPDMQDAILCTPQSSYRSTKKLLVRRCLNESIEAIIIGWTMLYSSEVTWGDIDQPPYFKRNKSFKVWLAEPLLPNRWLRPFKIQEEDLCL